jgi:hypothetical protein
LTSDLPNTKFKKLKPHIFTEEMGKSLPLLGELSKSIVHLLLDLLPSYDESTIIRTGGNTHASS